MPSRSSSQAAAMRPSASLTMACNPSRAALGVSLIAIGADHVRPRSVDLHTIRSPGSLAMALTTMASPLMATRGPRCRPSNIFGNCATLEGAAKLRPLSSERASQIVSPRPEDQRDCSARGGELWLAVRLRGRYRRQMECDQGCQASTCPTFYPIGAGAPGGGTLPYGRGSDRVTPGLSFEDDSGAGQDWKHGVQGPERLEGFWSYSR